MPRAGAHTSRGGQLDGVGDARLRGSDAGIGLSLHAVVGKIQSTGIRGLRIGRACATFFVCFPSLQKQVRFDGLLSQGLH